MQEIRLNVNTKNYGKWKIMLCDTYTQGQKKQYAIFPEKYFVNDDPPYCSLRQASAPQLLFFDVNEVQTEAHLEDFVIR